jgi:hypothetical protein
MQSFDVREEEGKPNPLKTYFTTHSDALDSSKPWSKTKDTNEHPVHGLGVRIPSLENGLMVACGNHLLHHEDSYALWLSSYHSHDRNKNDDRTLSTLWRCSEHS